MHACNGMIRKYQRRGDVAYVGRGESVDEGQHTERLFSPRDYVLTTLYQEQDTRPLRPDCESQTIWLIAALSLCDVLGANSACGMR